ncbi:MAG: type II toxin-antitoxin system RelB/DinJ family antitoxin [Alphaproteobacteria bacterium]|nr:type II toxin-antitoxin system RelB/DinJ family antitoxin [Alphaproteobacteria bacterium]
MTTLQTRISEDLKIRADALFKDMGLTTTDAVRMFLTQCINQGGLPFQPTGKIPNRQTLEALNEKSGTSYKSIEELSGLWK